MRGFHGSCSWNKLTCTQVKLEILTDLLKLDFLVFVQTDRAQPWSACTVDIYWEILSAWVSIICRENALSLSSTDELNCCPFRCVCKTRYFVIVRLNFAIVHSLHQEVWTFEFHQLFFKKVTLAGLDSLWQKLSQNSTWYFMILPTILFFKYQNKGIFVIKSLNSNT
jgi:hypothetical protein